MPGTGLRQAASILAAAGRPGDAIVYPGTDIPPWYLAYPAGFARPDNIGMARSPAVSGRLYGVSVPLVLLKLREQHAARVWVFEMDSWQDPARYLSSGYRLRHTWRLDQGLTADREIAQAKLYASEMAGRVTDRALQIFGGMGLMNELPLERMWRDVRVERIWDGTSEIQRHIIGRELLRPLGA